MQCKVVLSEALPHLQQHLASRALFQVGHMHLTLVKATVLEHGMVSRKQDNCTDPADASFEGVSFT